NLMRENAEPRSCERPCSCRAPMLASPSRMPADRAEVAFMTMATNGGEQPQAQQNPQLNVLAQYIKDFSFENPNAPRSLSPGQTQPAINIQINVGVGQLAPTDYEVTLKLEGKAELSGSVLFAFDLTFAGVFRIQNVPQETLQPL